MNEVYIKVEDLGTLSKHFKNKDIITLVEFISEMENLDADIESLKEQIEDTERDIEDNYRPVSKAEQYGVSERWFH